MRIEIEVAKPEHAPAISYIGRNAFRDAFGELFNNKCDLEDYLDYTYGVDKITNSVVKSNNRYFIATVDGSPAGFAKVKEHSLNEQFDSVFQAELQKLYVLKKFQGRGIGDKLMQQVIRFVEALEKECLWLDTHINNERGIRFYQKHGFRISGKYQFTIGSQTFNYYLMSVPVTVNTY